MLKSGDCFYKSYLEEDLSRAFVINYVIIFTVFPYNSEEMLNTIELERNHTLTKKDKKFLLAVAQKKID